MQRNSARHSKARRTVGEQRMRIISAHLFSSATISFDHDRDFRLFLCSLTWRHYASDSNTTFRLALRSAAISLGRYFASVISLGRPCTFTHKYADRTMSSICPVRIERIDVS